MGSDGVPRSTAAMALATAATVSALDVLCAVLQSGWIAPDPAELLPLAALAGLAALGAFALLRIAGAPLARRVGPARLDLALLGLLAGFAAAPCLARALGAAIDPLDLPRVLPVALALAIVAVRGARAGPRAVALAAALPLLLAFGVTALAGARLAPLSGAARAALLAGCAAGGAVVVLGALEVARRPRALLVLAGFPALAGLLPALVWVLPTSSPDEAPPAAQAQRTVRHVVLVVVDTLRADDLSHTGAEGAAATPAFDRLAAGATVFARARTPSPWTLPSVVAIQTGLAPEAHGVLREGQRLPDRATTLAQRLRRAGYATAAFGRNGVLLPHTGLDRGFGRYAFYRPRLATLGAALLRHVGADPNDGLVRDRALFETAADWLARHRAEDAFLWVHAYDPHAPYQPPPEQLAGRTPPAGLGRSFARMEAVRLGQFVPDRAQRDWIRALYRAEVRETDQALGRFLDRLRELGLYEDALIVVTSDHGEEFWEHDGFEHGHSVKDELLRVPLLVKPPGPARPRRVERPVTTTAVAPTVLALCGLPFDAAQFSAGPLLGPTGGDPEPPDDRPIAATGLLYFEDRSALVFDGWKLVQRHMDGRTELFDLEADPLELQPLRDPARLERGAALLARHRREAAELRARLGLEEARAAALDAALRRELEALGYVE